MQFQQIEAEAPKLEHVQSRLIECLYLLSSSRANEVYSKFGTLVSMAITLGLHRRKKYAGHRHEMDWIEHESRKRAFWAIYILDRYLSVMGGRPRLLQDEDINQDFPNRADDEDVTSEGIRTRFGSFDSVMDAPLMHIRYHSYSFTADNKDLTVTTD
jgi:hypothetical protein